MTQLLQTSIDGGTNKISRQQIDKFAERRTQLADAALQTLSELGYARTSLREIAQNSEFSHGVLHYYFKDKVDLITHCVRQYKSKCVTRYDQIVATAATAPELELGFGLALGTTLRDDARMHRLWYDLRAQALFEDSFRQDVAEIDASLERMIWRVATRFAELQGTRILVGPATMYAVFDGLFQQALLKYLAGDDHAVAELQAGVQEIITALIPAA